MKLFRFPGGVHPADHKDESSQTPIQTLPLLPHYCVPLSQHLGKPAVACVRVGERVKGGQLIGLADSGISAAIHAPTSGIVRAITAHPVAHPSGIEAPCIVIDSDGEDALIARTPINRTDPAATLARLHDLGLAGLGGAVFPTHIKLNPGPNAHWPILILNAAECEPWITCDDRLMQEHAAEIVEGARWMAELIGAQSILIGIEDNKVAAIHALKIALKAALHATHNSMTITVCPVPTLYPMGGGKQLTYALTGRVTPSGGRSTDVGVQMFNVGTVYALQRAIAHGEALTRRIVTVTGAVARPGNFEVRIGTPINDLIKAAGGVLASATDTLIGGPMMGFALHDPAAPVVKMVNCVLVKDAQHFPPKSPALPCIRCGACARACPVTLQPFEMYWYAQAKDLGKAQSYHLFDCIECGCCDFVCPSHIPLVDFFRFAKSEIWAREGEKEAADQARVRHEFRDLRLEREKREKAAKHTAAKAVATSASTAAAPADPEAARKKAIIQAALARAAASKAEITPKNTDALPADKALEIAEIEARRAQLRQTVHNKFIEDDPDAPREDTQT
jgi:Na+-translocating ferredoxin:NAD+ oxidoreductase subunit C